MTNRENFISLIRRKGYEYIPVEFVLCPSLQDKIKEQFGTEDYEKYFGFSWKRIEDIRLINHDTEKYRSFFNPPLAEAGEIDQWGVGHEFSPNSMHMTYMRHPLENAQSLEELKTYPFPDFLNGEKAHQKDQVEEAKRNDLITPVSYTHLDVYKRQFMSCRPKNRWTNFIQQKKRPEMHGWRKIPVHGIG